MKGLIVVVIYPFICEHCAEEGKIDGTHRGRAEVAVSTTGRVLLHQRIGTGRASLLEIGLNFAEEPPIRSPRKRIKQPTRRNAVQTYRKIAAAVAAGTMATVTCAARPGLPVRW
jgi:hypothetical protein